jgi:hypothetical protein
MRNVLIMIWIMLCSITSTVAQVSVEIGLPGVSIGINQPVYPDLVPVPGYPVYYAPQVNSNYFFYDGMYWVYQQDNWYASSWYNGPWGLVASEDVPLFILRVPVRYYRQPPAYFGGWASDAPPRWGEHWGNEWEKRRSGWDNWNRSAVPAPAPLPIYQRQYSGNRYPRAEQQQVLQSQNYRYQPKDAVVQQRYQAQRVQSAPASSSQQDQRATSRPSSAPQGALPVQRGQPPQTSRLDAQKAVAGEPQAQKTGTQPQVQQPQKGVAQTQAQQSQQRQQRVVQPQAQQAQQRVIQPQAQQPQQRVIQPQVQQPQKGVAQPQAQQPQKRVAQPQAQQPQKGVAPPQAQQPQQRVVQPQMRPPQKAPPQQPQGGVKSEQQPTKQGQEKDEKQGR